VLRTSPGTKAWTDSTLPAEMSNIARIGAAVVCALFIAHGLPADWQQVWRRDTSCWPFYEVTSEYAGGTAGGLLRFYDDQGQLIGVDRNGVEEILPASDYPEAPHVPCMIEAPDSGQQIVFSGTAIGREGWCLPIPRATRHLFDGTPLTSYPDPLDRGYLSNDGRVFVSVPGRDSAACFDAPEELGWSARFYDVHGRLVTSVTDINASFSDASMAPDGSRFVYYTSGEDDCSDARLVARNRRGRIVWVHRVPGMRLWSQPAIAVAPRGKRTCVRLHNCRLTDEPQTRLLDRSGRLKAVLPAGRGGRKLLFSRDGSRLLILGLRQAWVAEAKSGWIVLAHMVSVEHHRFWEGDFSRSGERIALAANLNSFLDGYRPEEHPSTGYVEVLDVASGNTLFHLAMPRDEELEKARPLYRGPVVRLSDDGTHLLVVTNRSLAIYRDR